MTDKALRKLGEALNHWQLVPSGTEGYRKAEVTLGGVDTRDLSSTTMMAREVANLYFVGEVVDVTGWLGGYNFQWAWLRRWPPGGRWPRRRSTRAGPRSRSGDAVRGVFPKGFPSIWPARNCLRMARSPMLNLRSS